MGKRLFYIKENPEVKINISRLKSITVYIETNVSNIETFYNQNKSTAALLSTNNIILQLDQFNEVLTNLKKSIEYKNK